MRVVSNRVSRIVLCTVLGCMGAACDQGTPVPATVQSTPTLGSPTPPPTALLSTTYSNELFGISFQYPANWKKKPGDLERYEGATGFFQIEGLSYSDGWTLDELARLKGAQIIMPYVTPLRIDSLQVGGSQARLIRPGADYLGDVAGQAGLLVQLPRHVQAEEETYNYLLLWTYEEYVDEITQTWRFL